MADAVKVYTVRATVKVATTSEHRAYHVIKHALTRGTLDEEIVYVDSEVVSQQPEDEGDTT